jgi:dolichol-phosphate mannosyltransferase
MKYHLSIVSPVYRAEGTVQFLIDEIINNISNITNNFEIILVEDGSMDASWNEIEQACKKNYRVKGIKLSRNFGQHYAITAGLTAIKGEWVIVMDCDLQDRPDQIKKLYEKAVLGNDIVFARRSYRLDSLAKIWSSQLFYRLFGYLTDSKQDATIANFGIYHNRVIQAILAMKDHIRYFPTMSQWVGFKKAYVDVQHGAREDSDSTYSWKRRFELAWNNIIAFSDKPLRLTIKFGFLISTFSGLVGLYYLIRGFFYSYSVTGFASLIISIWFLSGILIFTMGILGIYIGKIFEKVKDRPSFIIDKQINIESLINKNDEVSL